MPHFRLTACPVTDIQTYPCSVTGKQATVYSVALMADSVIPNERIEAKTVAEVEAALDAFAEKVKATGKPAQCSAYFIPNQTARKPNGYSKAKDSKRLERLVNFPEPAAHA